jgi:thiamine-monophosphate kinase
VPIHADAHKFAETTGKRAIEPALGDGEDFELLLTVSPEEAEHIIHDLPLDAPITRIGECVATEGLWMMDDAAKLIPLLPVGYRH